MVDEGLMSGCAWACRNGMMTPFQGNWAFCRNDYRLPQTGPLRASKAGWVIFFEEVE
jgi:hypothetical protein